MTGNSVSQTLASVRRRELSCDGKLTVFAGVMSLN